MREVGDDEDRDDRQRQNFADREHELPAIAHHFAFALRHQLHDVGVAVGDVAAERDAEKKPDHDEPADAGHECLDDGEDDEHDHRRQKHHSATDLVGKPAADQRADQRASLRSRRGQAQQQRIGIILLANEDQDEGYGIEVPGFDQDG